MIFSTGQKNSGGFGREIFLNFLKIRADSGKNIKENHEKSGKFGKFGQFGRIRARNYTKVARIARIFDLKFTTINIWIFKIHFII